MKKALLVLSLQTPFKSEVKKFRKKWKLPLNGFSSPEKRLAFEEKFGLKDSLSYEQNIQKILSNPQLKLSTNQKRYVRNYILHNDFTPDFYSRVKLPYERIGVSEIPLIGLENGTEKIILEIYRDTTLDDVKSVWKKVEKSKKKIPGFRDGRKSYPKKFLRDFRIYELRERGVSVKEIKEVIKTEFDDKVMEFEIPKVINRFKKKYIGK